MPATQFKLPIGAKRQVTIPREFMRQLSLEEGHELLLQVRAGANHATLTPVVSIPRNELPEALRRKFLARRGGKSADLPLSAFLDELQPPAKRPSGKKTSPPTVKTR